MHAMYCTFRRAPTSTPAERPAPIHFLISTVTLLCAPRNLAFPAFPLLAHIPSNATAACQISYQLSISSTVEVRPTVIVHRPVGSVSVCGNASSLDLATPDTKCVLSELAFMVLRMVAQAEDTGRADAGCPWQRMNGGRYCWVVMTKFSSCAGGGGGLAVECGVRGWENARGQGMFPRRPLTHAGRLAAQRRGPTLNAPRLYEVHGS